MSDFEKGDRVRYRYGSGEETVKATVEVVYPETGRIDIRTDATVNGVSLFHLDPEHVTKTAYVSLDTLLRSA